MSLSKIFVNDTQVVAVDKKPTLGSENLIESEGVFKATPVNGGIHSDIPEDKPDLDICDSDGNVLTRFYDGHIKTKNFNSKETSDELNAVI